MAQRADDIRHDIADTRAAMTEQLAMLEARVWETVVGTCTSVEKMMEEVGGIVEQVGGMVENVKATVDTTLVTVQQGVASTHASVEEIVGHVQGTIEETVATVKRTLDLPLQVEQHPWPMVGGALLAGYILGSWDGGRPSAPGPTPERGTEAAMPGPPCRIARVVRVSTAAARARERHAGSVAGRNAGRNRELPTRRGASRDEHIPRDVHASPRDPGPTHCERCDQDGRSTRRKPSAASGLYVLCSGQRGTGLELSEIKDTLNTIWHVQPAPDSGILSTLKARFMSLAVVLGIGFLLLVSLVISDVGIGAGITALLFVLSKFLIGLYLAKSSIGSVYGPAGSLVLLLAWIYYASLVFLFGAEFAAVYAHRHGSRAIRDGAAHHRAWREPAGGAPLKRRVTRTAMYHGPQES